MEELEGILKHEATPRPVDPDPRARDERLRLRGNVTYMVAGVLFDGDKVLMIQENRQTCNKGTWYIPVGRMEANETIIEAVQREVLKESGLTFEPEAVIMVECMLTMWVRVTLTGRVTGGSLKTTAQADAEVLQAGWFSKQELSFINLRDRDVLPLIDKGQEWAREGGKYGGLPVQMGHVRSSLRLILVARDNAQLMVLVSSNHQGSTSFPVIDLNSFHDAMDRELKSCGYKGDCSVKGVLSLEHLGRPHGVHDGMCISVLLEATSTKLEGWKGYQWCKIKETLEEPIKAAMKSHCAKLRC